MEVREINQKYKFVNDWDITGTDFITKVHY